LGVKSNYDIKNIAIPTRVRTIITTLHTSFAVGEDGTAYTWPIRD
jgi:hypothetical protein